MPISDRERERIEEGREYRYQQAMAEKQARESTPDRYDLLLDWDTSGIDDDPKNPPQDMSSTSHSPASYSEPMTFGDRLRALGAGILIILYIVRVPALFFLLIFGL